MHSRITPATGDAGVSKKKTFIAEYEGFLAITLAEDADSALAHLRSEYPGVPNRLYEREPKWAGGRAQLLYIDELKPSKSWALFDKFFNRNKKESK